MRALLFVAVLAACTPDAGDIRYAPPRADAVVPTGSTGTTPSTSPTDPSDPTTPDTTTGDPPWGIDISHWNSVSDWDRVADSYGFAIMKATEGTYYTDDTFGDSSAGALAAGMTRGAYHFAIPDDSSGAEQAAFFVDNGGGWTADGVTLPGTLDIEWNPNGPDDCYDLSRSEMSAWVQDFMDAYFDLTGRDAIIYTSATWWDMCVDSADFSANPLWVAHYGVDAPDLPVGWSSYTIWQTTGYGSVDGVDGDVDVDLFGGPPSALENLALGR